MDLLIIDRSLAHISKKVMDLIRAYRILDWQSEPHHQHQNYSERRIQDYKKRTSVILNQTAAPGNAWLLALLYVIFILNCIAYAVLDWRTPLEVWGGSTPDISIITQFCFWDLVYYSVDNNWPSQYGEKLAHFVGFGDTVGDALTYKLLTVDTKKIIYRSAVRAANLGDNKRLEKFKGQDHKKPLVEGLSTGDSGENLSLWKDDTPLVLDLDTSMDDLSKPQKFPAKSFDPDEIIGLTFLKDGEDGTRNRCEIIRKTHEIDKDTSKRRTKYLVKVPHSNQDEILNYSDVVKLLSKQYQDDLDPDRLWTFKEIVDHEGPLKPGDKNYNVSTWNLLIEWEDNTITQENFTVIAVNDPVSCALYSKENSLLKSKAGQVSEELPKMKRSLRGW